MHPGLLGHRGELLEKARAAVVANGYPFKKGKSRSKVVVEFPESSSKPRN